MYAGKPVAYCPYIFVDNDAALARGWTQGYPKRLGQVFQTRYHAATGKAGPALAPGSKFAGSLTAGGQRLAEGVVTLREPVADLSHLKERPVVNLLHYPRLAAEKQDKPAIHELVENVLRIQEELLGEEGERYDAELQRMALAGSGREVLATPAREAVVARCPVVLRRAPLGGDESARDEPVERGVQRSLAYVVDDLRTLKDLRK